MQNKGTWRPYEEKHLENSVENISSDFIKSKGRSVQIIKTRKTNKELLIANLAMDNILLSLMKIIVFTTYCSLLSS